jgi:hypothetical protein
MQGLQSSQHMLIFAFGDLISLRATGSTESVVIFGATMVGVAFFFVVLCFLHGDRRCPISTPLL